MTSTLTATGMISRLQATGDRRLVVSAERGLLNPAVRAGLEHLCAVMGTQPCSYTGRPASIYYGADREAAKAVPVWIEPDPQFGPSSLPWSVSLVEGLPVPHIGQPPARLWDGNRASFDLFRAAAFWLTLQSERDFGLLDEHGRPRIADTRLTRLALLDHPPIQAYARILGERLASLGCAPPTIPRWPAGRRYAVALSHDVDAPERPGGLAELLRLGLHPQRLGLRGAYWQFRSQVRRHGVLEQLCLPPARRKAWDFASFSRIEADAGFRSAFYLSVVPRSIGHPNDVSYDAARRRYRRLFRSLRDGGWEVGLHAGYSTCEGRPPIDRQMAGFRRIFGFAPVGVRHHYLRLSSDAPMETLATHAAAGLLYDTSVGFNEAPGLRAGTAWPYEPPATHLGSGPSLLELPMTLADMHLPRDDVTAATTIVLEHLGRVREIGGLAVLNWHVGNWESHAAWRESYRAAIRWLSEDREAWVATPEAICRWWTSRSST